jgi:transcriptional regulator with XRE-family HTH domain
VRLREVAEQRGYSRSRLAQLLQVSDSTIDRWCRGEAIPQRRLRSIAGLFGEEDAAAIFRAQGAVRGPGRPPVAQRDRQAVHRVADIARRRGREGLAREIEGL